MVRIVVDAMGGDYAPVSVIKGVIEAVKKFNVIVVLVGISDRIKLELAKYKFDPSKIEIVHADEIVEMHESPTVAIRKKKNSSISIGVNLVKEGKADAFF